MRRAFSDILTQSAAEDDRLAFITGDLGFQVFTEFEKNYPGRFINAGVAEAQMINTAAGMALEGWHPIAYSIASFATARPFEQIRYCVAYPKLPVILVGAGRGYTYAVSGVSHHASDDLGLMSLLPGMTVVAPGDPGEVRQLFPQVLQLRAPAYFTVGRFGEPAYEAEEPAILGKGRLVRKGSGIAILTVAEMVHQGIKAHEALESSGIAPTLYQFHTVKPLDTAILDALAASHHALVVVEEHMPSGGLWSALCQWAAGRSSESPRPQLVRLGPPDAFILGNPKREELWSRYGFDFAAIVRKCQELTA